MTNSKTYGVALIAGALGGMVTMMSHPTSRDLLGQIDQVARRNEILALATHRLALLSIPILTFGFLGLSRLLRLDRPIVLAAFVFYSFAAIGAMCATIASGLIAPAITRQILSGDSNVDTLRSLLWFDYLFNQAFAKVFFTMSCVAILFWSLSIMKINRLAQTTGVIGCVIASISLLAFLGGHLRLDVHGFLIFILGQAIWTILISILLFRWKHESPPVESELR
jgi:hypothetical protein